MMKRKEIKREREEEKKKSVLIQRSLTRAHESDLFLRSYDVIMTMIYQ